MRYYKINSDNTREYYTGNSIIADDRLIFNPTEDDLIMAGYEAEEDPQPTAEQLLNMAIESKIAEIDAHSNSDAVNELTYNGMKTWLTPDVRANYKVSIDAAELLGEDDITFAIGGKAVTATIEEAKMLLARIQRYADATYMVTVQHKANVSNLKSIEDVETYDFTKGYPKKLTF